MAKNPYILLLIETRFFVIPTDGANEGPCALGLPSRVRTLPLDLHSSFFFYFFLFSSFPFPFSFPSLFIGFLDNTCLLPYLGLHSLFLHVHESHHFKQLCRVLMIAFWAPPVNDNVCQAASMVRLEP